MTDYKATSDQWNQVQKCADVVGSSDCSAILELRARVEALEAAAHKHIVETNSNIVALFTRVESLEAAERQASKVYEISKPLKLTAKQQEQLNVLLRPATSQPSPNSSQVGSSLVDRVSTAIALEDEKHYWPSTEGDALCCHYSASTSTSVGTTVSNASGVSTGAFGSGDHAL